MGGRNPGTPVSAPLNWRRATCAPSAQFARDGAEVVIRYRYAGEVHELRFPGVVWFALVQEAHAATFTTLTSAWTAWAVAGGLVRHVDGHVDLRYGYLGLREIRLPATIWGQILAAIRARAIDDL
ncbi:hypothetical protein ThrDRAFT_02825 [Frankia casuarinae]|uniref:Uncharacterized protein n=1 Tax=Frankia casuarinae (strain DSM 45818 / CECT 9043 / HFP020203 / CcI3) TaxID=106370 RepID=Q2J7S5_FRACC|nr:MULTISPECIES: hypothetical protein [Frankia]ABD12667.1 hypothetical protein Francci3_3310 [Frankia casuarinae]EYT91490.1 hypothetical protein ThrDRAFT_02825 [Frankia casuarinae]KDA41221.1 hypothetical protein BMG523Draft_03955 [Frankia sp. BMG5.23]TFE27390.1 hypothetical protein E0F15_16395 [Frankia sp. B2]